jgi:hypothetical protein
MEANENDRKVSSITEFQVSDIRQELTETDMRLENLQRIADLTGGSTLGIRELPKLASLVNGESLTTTVRSERPLWDHWLVILLLAGLLGAEWILRRRHDLP